MTRTRETWTGRLYSGAGWGLERIEGRGVYRGHLRARLDRDGREILIRMTGKQMRSQAEMLIAAADRMEEYLKRNPAAIAWDGEGQED